jgi:hypothetical protein
MVALDDRPRPGREPTITIEAKAWLTSLACRKAKELGYPHELWTTRQSRLRKSAQDDKWSFCLTAGKIGPRTTAFDWAAAIDR